MTDKPDCIFFNTDILEQKICMKGNAWECETDATVCGDYTTEEK